MALIAGYARRPEKRWPLITLIIVVFAVLFLILLFLVPADNSQVKKATTITKVTVTSKTLKEVVPTTQAKPADKKEVEKRAEPAPITIKGITIERFVLATAIDEGNKPLDEIDRVEIGKSWRIYCYTRLNSETVPLMIHHVWIGPSGAIAADIPLTISHQPADTWSYKNLTGEKPGEWTVEIKRANGETLARKKIVTF